jgi:hypothetical protein
MKPTGRNSRLDLHMSTSIFGFPAIVVGGAYNGDHCDNSCYHHPCTCPRIHRRGSCVLAVDHDRGTSLLTFFHAYHVCGIHQNQYVEKWAGCLATAESFTIFNGVSTALALFFNGVSSRAAFRTVQDEFGSDHTGAIFQLGLFFFRETWDENSWD